jgi:hypothetical protein|tara:strand:+ start:844 stop:1359 length:516 start_codon:yes stop_codon:yes gene_type:complete
MRLELQYTRSASAAIWVDKLEGYDNDLYEKQILARGDEQKRKTNVQADMTSWFIPEWKKLCEDVVNNHIVKLSGEMDVIWAVHEIWGANYRKGDYTRFHAHRPSIFSFCYYVRADKDSAPLVFADLDYELYPEESQLVVFPAHLNHGVPSQRVAGRRTVIAGNILKVMESS